ncbi:hypothetical protein A2U01_0036163 [Trifolium medium]|uniref:Uncharacterized protein n=1 Tax=Trifolium medium TaxID=97028 RepID=A0A392PSE8_9FABA|nr:hypothetical protein [Trifolium medium]
MESAAINLNWNTTLEGYGATGIRRNHQRHRQVQTRPELSRHTTSPKACIVTAAGGERKVESRVLQRC